MTCHNCHARSTQERAEPLVDVERGEVTRQHWCPKCQYITFSTHKIQKGPFKITSEKL